MTQTTKLSRLKKVREKKGLSQSALWRKSGITQSTISVMEAGHTSPSLDSALKLARALKVRVEDLV